MTSSSLRRKWNTGLVFLLLWCASVWTDGNPVHADSPSVNVAGEGTPIVSVTSPRGGGNHDLEVIRDGVKPEVGSADSGQQYDTVDGKAMPKNDYFGYTFTSNKSFTSLVFQEGKHFSDGGWFKNGSVKIQVRKAGIWNDVATTVDKEYPNGNTQDAFGQSFETYTFTLNAPAIGDGIRIYGAAGGTNYFTSAGEVEAWAFPAPPSDPDGETATMVDNGDQLDQHENGNLIAASYDADKDFNGDAARYQKAVETQEGYIVYAAPEGKAISSISADYYQNDWPDVMLDMKVLASSDKVSYTEIRTDKDQGSVLGSVWGKSYKHTAALPAGTKFVKVVIPARANDMGFDTSYANQIGKVELQIVDGGPGGGDGGGGGSPDSLTDGGDELSLHPSGNLQTASFDAGKDFNGDAARYQKIDETQDGYIVYAAPAGKNIVSLSVDYYQNDWPDVMLDLKVLASSDNAAYKQIQTDKDQGNVLGSVWGKSYKHTASLPAGTKYLKIVIPARVKDMGLDTSWANQIGKVELQFGIGKIDVRKPVITLQGDRTEYVWQNSLYFDEGATAQDDTDGNITGQIALTGQADTGSPGTYTLQYNVSDAAGNPADTVKRTVIVTAPHKPVKYFVSPSGSDTNPGTSSKKPFQTLQKAHDVSLPGDTIYIMNGTYTVKGGEGVLQITRSGVPGAFITYKAYPGHKPKITADRSWNNILIAGASYIVIEGLEIAGLNPEYERAEVDKVYEYLHDLVVNNKLGEADWNLIATTSTNGIFAREDHATQANPHHIIIRNNIVHDVPGCGIGSSRADYITIEDNVVYNNSFYSPWANSGISVFLAKDFDDNTRDYKTIIRRNKSFNNMTKVKWAFTGAYSDGNGIIIDSFRVSDSNLPAYRGRTLVTNNLVYGNGGSGIHSFDSANVDIVNNTAYNNSVNPELDYGAVFAGNSDNVRILNNIVYVKDGEKANDSWDNRNVVYDFNLWYNYSTIAVQGPHDVTGDPKFVAPDKFNFQLAADSPAIDKGNATLAPLTDIQKRPRPVGYNIDLGAYESIQPPSVDETEDEIKKEERKQEEKRQHE